MNTERGIDHLVLTTNNLTGARERYTKLGFNVAPNGRHPFGTENANIYFHDGAMVETLAIADADECAVAIENDNTFVINDHAYRSSCGDVGFSHFVATTDDATADDQRFRDLNVSGGSLVNFSRDFRTPEGNIETLAVRLAFATDPQAPGTYFFTCQTIASPNTSNSSLLDHKNGATGIAQIVLCASHPTDHTTILEDLYGRHHIDPSDHEDGIHFETANGQVSILTPAEILDGFDLQHTSNVPHLVHRGIVLNVVDLSLTRSLFEQNEIHFIDHNNRLIIPADDQLGAFIAFKDM